MSPVSILSTLNTSIPYSVGPVNSQYTDPTHIHTSQCRPCHQSVYCPTHIPYLIGSAMSLVSIQTPHTSIPHSVGPVTGQYTDPTDIPYLIVSALSPVSIWTPHTSIPHSVSPVTSQYTDPTHIHTSQCQPCHQSVYRPHTHPNLIVSTLSPVTIQTPYASMSHSVHPVTSQYMGPTHIHTSQCPPCPQSVHGPPTCPIPHKSSLSPDGIL